MTIFTVFFSLFWLQILKLPASLQNKNTRDGPFPWKRSVLQNPDRERTNQSTGICLRLGLPYNKFIYCGNDLNLKQGKNTHAFSVHYPVFLLCRLALYCVQNKDDHE